MKIFENGQIQTNEFILIEDVAILADADNNFRYKLGVLGG